MSRIKPVDAMEHLGLERDSFLNWLDATNLKAHSYEFSNRTYFIKGEFLALADKDEINKIKKLHPTKWKKEYQYYAEVKPFLNLEKDAPPIEEIYEPKSQNVSDFMKKLKG